MTSEGNRNSYTESNNFIYYFKKNYYTGILKKNEH